MGIRRYIRVFLKQSLRGHSLLYCTYTSNQIRLDSHLSTTPPSPMVWSRMFCSGLGGLHKGCYGELTYCVLGGGVCMQLSLMLWESKVVKCIVRKGASAQGKPSGVLW